MKKRALTLIVIGLTLLAGCQPIPKPWMDDNKPFPGPYTNETGRVISPPAWTNEVHHGQLPRNP